MRKRPNDQSDDRGEVCEGQEAENQVESQEKPGRPFWDELEERVHDGGSTPGGGPGLVPRIYTWRQK